MTTSTYFPASPYDGVVTFEGPELHLAAVQQQNFPMAEMPRLMDGIFPAIFAALAQAGATPVGPALALHSRMPTDTVDFAVGVPVATPLARDLELPSGYTVVATPFPTGPVAATSYIGPFEGLGQAWGRFMDGVVAAGHSPSSDFFEAYVSNPAETEDPAKLRTDLVVFLAD